jgi:hypothetical protein
VSRVPTFGWWQALHYWQKQNRKKKELRKKPNPLSSLSLLSVAFLKPNASIGKIFLAHAFGSSNPFLAILKK